MHTSELPARSDSSRSALTALLSVWRAGSVEQNAVACAGSLGLTSQAGAAEGRASPDLPLPPSPAPRCWLYLH